MSNAKYNIEKLPKWAQRIFQEKERDIDALVNTVDGLRKAHSLLNEMDWFTLGVHTPEKRNVYFLDKDRPNLIAAIGAGAVMLIGHPKTA